MPTLDISFVTGLLGSLVLVTGAAWPETAENVPPYKSAKDWLFAVGGLLMLAYAILGYLAGGPVFFVFLEVLVVIASLLMMLNTPDAFDTPVISLVGLGFIAWSLTLFEGYNTVFFILGLTGVGLGYAFQMGTVRRSLALTAGSVLIALFSYIEQSWIFFWLNVFFAIFSSYYVLIHFFAPVKFFTQRIEKTFHR